MIILGILLLIAGYLIGVGPLITIGWVVLAIGLILLISGMAGDGVGGRRHWY